MPPEGLLGGPGGPGGGALPGNGFSQLQPRESYPHVWPACKYKTFSPKRSLLSISRNSQHTTSPDDCRILLDCGWDERFDTGSLHALASVSSSIDFVLLSHPALPHLGALPYAAAQLGLDCPIIATRPVWQMGHLSMYDVLLSRKANCVLSCKQRSEACTCKCCVLSCNFRKQRRFGRLTFHLGL